MHSNCGNYSLAIHEEDWKLILPVGVYTIRDHTIDPSEVVEITGKGLWAHFQLYEAWGKPEEANEWRAKLPQTEAVFRTNPTGQPEAHWAVHEARPERAHNCALQGFVSGGIIALAKLKCC